MWTFVPAQAAVQKFLDTFKEFPPTTGGSLSIDAVLDQLQAPPVAQ
jgi:arylsulfatase